MFYILVYNEELITSVMSLVRLDLTFDHNCVTVLGREWIFATAVSLLATECVRQKNRWRERQPNEADSNLSVRIKVRLGGKVGERLVQKHVKAEKKNKILLGRS